MSIYAIGLPGALVRVILETDHLVQVAHNIREGEVVVQIAERPPAGRVRISADGAEIVAEDFTLAERREARRAEAKAVRQMAEDGLCATQLGVIQTPLASRLNNTGLVTDAMLAKGAGEAFSQPFRMADDSMVTHGADAMIALGRAVRRHMGACAANYFAIADAINASDDPQIIDIAAGYPAVQGQEG